MTKERSIPRVWVSIALAVLLSLFGFTFRTPNAYATSSDLAIKDAEAAVAQSKLTLAEAESRLAQISDEYDSLYKQVSQMQSQINALAIEVLDAQDAMIRGREALGTAMQHEYRSNQASVFLSMILGSQSISELTQNIDYITQIIDYQNDEINTQKEIKEDLEQKSMELTQQKDSQEEVLFQLEQKKSEALSVVNQVEDELEANSGRLDTLRKQAEELSKKEDPPVAKVQYGQEADANKTPATSAEAQVSSEAKDDSAQQQEQQQEEQQQQQVVESSSSDAGDWKTGVASAYGGSTDPYTPNPGRTATGAVCDDYSMGVAIPMSWSNYSSYFGRTVQISYGGMTVTAVVNDCGGMGGGSRSLDLQPGVFKAFGFNTCNDWGIRTVSYRFL